MLFVTACGLGLESQDSFCPETEHSKDILMGEQAYKKSAWGYLCRTLCMLGFPVVISSHGSFFPPGRSRDQIDSYSAHPMPFLSLLYVTSGSAILMQLRYQHPPPYHLLAAASGTTQFHSFVSLPLVLAMSGQGAIGRDSPGKKHNTMPDFVPSYSALWSWRKNNVPFLSPPQNILCSTFLFSPWMSHLFFTTPPLLALDSSHFPPWHLQERKQSCETGWAHPLPIAGWGRPQLTTFRQEKFMCV